MKRTYVTVILKFDTEGIIIPLKIIFNDKEYEIDKIINVKNHLSRMGGVNNRFEIKIAGKVTYLFYDVLENRWFVEEK